MRPGPQNRINSGRISAGLPDIPSSAGKTCRRRFTGSRSENRFTEACLCCSFRAAPPPFQLRVSERNPEELRHACSVSVATLKWAGGIQTPCLTAAASARSEFRGFYRLGERVIEERSAPCIVTAKREREMRTNVDYKFVALFSSEVSMIHGYKLVC